MFARKLFVLLLVLSVAPFASAKNKINTANSLLGLQIPKDHISSSGQLLYYGGPVISHVKVFVGIWNDRVNPEVKTKITDFYAAYVNSTHMDWLNEYRTNVKAVDGRAGTDQVIERGTVLGEKLMTPSITAKRITDTQIQQEIEKQIDAGNFPRPDNDTLYMLHFSKDMQISIEGMTSCFSFGGYHNNFKSAKYGDIAYGVMPECSGLGGSGFSSITFVASHELIEAVTDPFPTPGSSPAYPQAWNTTDGSEIADVCSGRTSLVGPKGTYTISEEWSNTRTRCYNGQ
jgi:hypothetical protein